ncbi:MAG: zinc-finger domain-containing protein [Litorimonas sp.]
MSDVHTDNVEIVTSKRVSCNGRGGALGHPRVFMDMAGGTSVICKYCGRVFKLDPNSDGAGHH